jgi:voltage-gated potassium channel
MSPAERTGYARFRKRVVRVRRRLYEILEQSHPGDMVSRVTHAMLMGFVLASVIAVVLESVPVVHARHPLLFLVIEWFSVAVFTIEYGLRLWVAVDYPPLAKAQKWRARLIYALSLPALIDLLTILPLYITVLTDADFGAFVVFRLLRFLKLARYSPGIRSLYEAVSNERRALLACLVILATLVLASAAVMHLIEARAQPDKFGTIPDAMWWAIVTLTTVGYGDVVPITPLGKIAAGLTALMGFILLALPVGIIATSFAEVIHRRDFVVTWGMVARVPIFAGLDAEDVAQIMRFLRSESVEAGEIIVRRGDIGNSMYFIAAGQVELDRPKRPPTYLSEGSFFGEMAILREVRRTATVRALVRTDLLMLDAVDLRLLMQERPHIAQRIEEASGARDQDFSGEIAS